jgi:hypothetical protein
MQRRLTDFDHSDTLLGAKSQWRDHLNEYELALTRLDNIGEAMSSMLEHQASVAVSIHGRPFLAAHSHLISLDRLCRASSSIARAYSRARESLRDIQIVSILIQ